MALADETQRLQILVAVPTYNRNEMLDGLLESLSKLDLPETAHVSFAIIDNNPSGFARPVVEKWQAIFSAPLMYYIEARPGVTHVRNRALELASDRDALVFIDDDEFAAPGWLSALTARYLETRAAAVFGPVQSVYPESAPGWIKAWGVHGTDVSEDVETLKPGATCNCFIDMHQVRQAGLTFDPRMSLTGAEDTLFFTELLARGARMVLAKDALVYEHVPESRATVSWLMRRWYRTGLTDALIAGRHMKPWMSRLRAGIHGVIRVSIGGLLTALTTIFTLGINRRAIMERVYTVSRGLGMMSFALGKTYEEYGRKKSA